MAMTPRFGTLVATALLASPLLAQEHPVPHAPDGTTFERIQSISIPPVPNAPFSAVVVTELTKILPDGTTTSMKNHRTIARDSAGRIFQERRFFSPTGDVDTTRLQSMEYTDPARHELYVCHPERKLCSLFPYYGEPPVTPPVHAPTGVTSEALGQMTIANLDALGSREITTIPAGTLGNKIPEPIVKEFWYSPRLGINLIVKRFDPRFGAQNFTVTNLNLTEPDPATLAQPADFRLVPAATR